ncbi:MAG: class I SAM-dependent methyltransferase [Alphaproteobacteria bacterium]|nr:class I SAM-dependent methyltransferase [Alphaproteobacteria bacterium]
MPSDFDHFRDERALDVRAEYEQIYAEPDPRAYFRVLHGLDYRIPELARALFRSVIQSAAAARGERAKVLDLGCGFGINAALLRYPIDMNRLAHRYRDLDAGDLTPERVVELDRHYFASWPELMDMTYSGVDLSATSTCYAAAAGLLDHAIAGDLETADLSEADRRAIAGTNCIISTGFASYAGARTFERILDAAGERPPWLALFGLRTESLAEVCEFFTARGMQVEKLEGVTFVQRRYHSASEWTQSLMMLETLGIDTEGKEADGLMHAELFVVRPPADVAAYPLETIISVSSGGEGLFGGWRGRPWGT